MSRQQDLLNGLIDANRKVEELQRELDASTRVWAECGHCAATACEWTPFYEDDQPDEAESLTSGCGHEWMSGEGDPPGRWMKFCPFCGGAAVFAAQSEGEPVAEGGLIEK